MTRTRGCASSKGFTLIEIIVAVAILMIVAGIALPTGERIIAKAKQDKTRDEMAVLSDALLAYITDNEAWPDDLETLVGEGFVGGGFQESDPVTDAWGNLYTYTHGTDQGTLRSLGSDRVKGPDDPTLSVDARPTMKRMTRDEMETIHVALQAYEILRSKGQAAALPNKWGDWGNKKGACRLLYEAGFLPKETPYEKDAWGTDYDYSGSPSDEVTSPNV